MGKLKTPKKGKLFAKLVSILLKLGSICLFPRKGYAKYNLSKNFNIKKPSYFYRFYFLIFIDKRSFDKS